MPISWVNSINPVMVIVFAGVFAAVWTRLGAQPVTPIKFGLGTVVMGVAFWPFLLNPGGEHARRCCCSRRSCSSSRWASC